MQYDNIYEIKENKKDNNLKTQTLITSTKIRVQNYKKIHQRIVKMQEKKKSTKNEKKKNSKREREREREIIFCVWENYV